MSNRTVLKSLLLISAGFLVAPACKIDRSTSTGGGAGGSSGGAGGSGGSGGSDTGGSGGSDTGGSGGSDTGGSGGSSASGLCSFTPDKDKYSPGYTPDAAAKKKAKEVRQGMSMDEKIAQMVGVSFGTTSNPQFGDIQRSPDTSSIRGFRWRDASRGMDLGEDMEGAQPSPGYSTVFPVSVLRGAAFDLDIEYQIGQAIADEMVAARQTVLLAPCMNLIRHPLWGRAQESYSEDPYHTGRFASALVVGIQEYIPANAKHYLGYSIEKDRPGNNSQMEDEQTLREIYGRHFRMAIQDGGVVSVMAAYNKVNGIKCTNSSHLLTDVLRTDFGFQGFVLSDWFAMPGYANPDIDTPTLKAAAKEAIMAGLDIELPWELNYGQLKSLVDASALDVSYIDAAVDRILEQKFRFKVDNLDGPVGLKTATTTYKNGAVGNNSAHLDLSRKAAEKGMVLLKNDNMLPIPASAKKIAVIGASVPYNTSTGSGTIDFTKEIRTGDLGSSRVYYDPKDAVGPYDGISAYAKSIDKNITVTTGSKASDASNADFIVVMAGLTAQDEGEEYNGSGDRTSLALDDKNGNTVQNDLIAAVAALKKPMVVVLEGGAVISMPWLGDVPAVVMAWYPGQRGGEALANLLFGKVSFSGKLPVSWPNDLKELNQFNGQGTTTFYYDVGYRLYDRKAKTDPSVKPLFAFGYGLSYTKFEYGDLELPCSQVDSKSVFPVKVKVKNAGSVDADETVFVFVSFPNTKARRGVKELKAFKRVTLKAGEEQQVTIPVRVSDLDYYDNDKQKWIIETGDVNIMVGPSSDNLAKTGKVTIK